MPENRFSNETGTHSETASLDCRAIYAINVIRKTCCSIGSTYRIPVSPCAISIHGPGSLSQSLHRRTGDIHEPTGKWQTASDL